jgi:carbohydrate kinase (thermoresistant glucokinase family)
VSTWQVVVMGVSGCGKSTVGALLAQQLSAEFVEGDSLHPASNVEKMAAGTPLTDADREGWLQTIAAQLGTAHTAGRSLVVSCSALKRAYRDTLRASAPDLRLVYLQGDFDLLGARVAARSGHYMPASLLASQFAALQEPSADEHAITLDCRVEPETLAAQAFAALTTESPA